MRQIIMLESLVLKLRCFLRIVRHELVSHFVNGRIYKDCEIYGGIVPLRNHTWELLFKIGIFRLLKRFDVDPVLEVLVIARSYEIASDAEGCLGWYPYNLAGCIVMRAPEYTDISRERPLACP